MLPTHPIKEDTNEVRELNRRKALNEMLLILGVRSVPGRLVVIFAAAFLVWVCYKILTIFHV